MGHSVRFVDRGVTLRLFPERADALVNGFLTDATEYACGWLAKDRQGRWADAHGPLPAGWEPDPALFVRSGGAD